jgi:hypothetical protein
MKLRLVCDCGEELVVVRDEAVECSNCGRRYTLTRKQKDTVEA